MPLVTAMSLQPGSARLTLAHLASSAWAYRLALRASRLAAITVLKGFIGGVLVREGAVTLADEGVIFATVAGHLKRIPFVARDEQN